LDLQNEGGSLIINGLFGAAARFRCGNPCIQFVFSLPGTRVLVEHYPKSAIAVVAESERLQSGFLASPACGMQARNDNSTR
jgi:hypothetical protein